MVWYHSICILSEIRNMSKRNTPLVNAQIILAICGIVGPILYVLVVITLGTLEPDYSHLSQTMSVLGAADARYNIIMNTAGFSLLGLLFIAFSAGLDHSIADGRFSKIGPTLIALSGISLIMIGIFPCDLDSVDMTTGSKIHSTFVAVAILAMILSLIAISPRLWGDDRWRSYVAYTIWTMLMMLIVAVIYGFGGFESWEGALQRILMAFPLIWMEVMAIRILHLS